MFIWQDIVVCFTLSFTIGLYVGAFVQRRRDVREMREESIWREDMEKLLDKLTKEGGTK